MGNIGRRSLDDARLAFLRKYLEFILHSKVLSPTTKIYIRSACSSMRAAFEQYNVTVPEWERINLKTALSKVNYDKNKLSALFAEDMLMKVVFTLKPDMVLYEKSLNAAIRRYAPKAKQVNGLRLKLPPSPPEKLMTDDEFEEIIDLIAPYSTAAIKSIEDTFPPHWAGYLGYLTSGTELNTAAQRHLRLLQAILKEAPSPNEKVRGWEQDEPTDESKSMEKTSSKSIWEDFEGAFEV
jgi:hypothetical protein